jgi:hypothetical protein
MVASIAALADRTARAEQTAGLLDLQPTNAAVYSIVVGTEFTPVAGISVTSIGWYDDVFFSANGLAASHPVGIFDRDAMALLVSGTVPSGTAAPKTNAFRFIPVSPTQLEAGHAYVVAGLTTGDLVYDAQPAALNVDSLMTIGAQRYGVTSTLSFPTTVSGVSYREMGATFTFTMVPEPAALALLAVTGGAITSCRRRTR